MTKPAWADVYSLVEASGNIEEILEQLIQDLENGNVTTDQYRSRVEATGLKFTRSVGEVHGTIKSQIAKVYAGIIKTALEEFRSGRLSKTNFQMRLAQSALNILAMRGEEDRTVFLDFLYRIEGYR